MKKNKNENETIFYSVSRTINFEGLYSQLLVFIENIKKVFKDYIKIYERPCKKGYTASFIVFI